LTEQNIQEALKEVRIALLEADVNFKVVKDFIQQVQGRAVGQEVMGSLTPAQQMIKIVKEEMTAMIGGRSRKFSFREAPPFQSCWWVSTAAERRPPRVNWPGIFRRRGNGLTSFLLTSIDRSD